MAFGDPAALLLGIEVLDEFGGDFGDQGLKTLITAVFLGVKPTVAMNHPTHVAGLVGAENVRLLRRFGCEHAFDCLHGANEFFAVGHAKAVEYSSNFAGCSSVERFEFGAAFVGELDRGLAGVVGRGL